MLIRTVIKLQFFLEAYPDKIPGGCAQNIDKKFLKMILKWVLEIMPYSYAYKKLLLFGSVIKAYT